MKRLFNLILIFIISIFLWLFVDIVATNFLDIRGFSKFLTAHKKVGHINKPNFKGHFGGPFNDFYANVSIGSKSERTSSNKICKTTKEVIFIGDSTVAGFEVEDDETFVSLINLSCKDHGLSGINFGVRVHDTHGVIGNYQRVGHAHDHQAVFYLISHNDVTGNNIILDYKNIVMKFGRIYDGNFYKPKISFIKKIYYGIRVFVSDNFYFTTKYIRTLEMSSNVRNEKKIKLSKVKPYNIKDIERLVTLLSILKKEVDNNRAGLFVGFSPCLNYDCEKEIELENLLSKEINKRNLDIRLFKIIKKVNDMALKRPNIKRKMKFRSDQHLSKFGHKIISYILVNELINSKI